MGGGRAYSFGACLSHLTFGHASLSRRGAATHSLCPPPHRLGAQCAFFVFYVVFCPLSCLLLRFGPSMATIHLLRQRSLSRYHQANQTSPSRIPFVFLLSSSIARSVPTCTVHVPPLSGVYSRLRCHKGRALCAFSSSARLLVPQAFSSFRQILVPYTRTNFPRFRVAH